MPAFIEKNYVGKTAGKLTLWGAAPAARRPSIQINEPVAEHTHADADEFIYVIAGRGAGRVSASARSRSVPPSS